LNSTPGRIAFDNARISLDGMNGSGDVTLTTGARTYAKANLALDRLDLKQYTGSSGPRGAGGAIATWSESAIDFAGLRAIDADLAFAVDALSAGGLRIGRSVLDFDLRAGKLRANLKQMALYGGNGTGTVTLNGAGAAPDVGIDLALSGVKAEPLLTDGAGFNRLSGVGNMTLKLAAAGRSQSAMMRSLDGTVQIKFEDGAVKGANLAEVARTIQSVLTGAAIGASAKTDFAELSGSLVVQNGVGRNEDLKLLNPFVRLSGAGVLDVGNQTLNYRVEPRAVRSMEGQGGKNDLRGVGIPFKIKGPWSKLSYSPDLTGVTTGVIDSIVQGRDPLEDLKNQTGLDALFGNKKPPAAAQPAPAPEAPAPAPAPTPAPTPPQPQPAAPPPAEPKPQPQPAPAPESQPQEETAPPPAQNDQSVPSNTQQEGAAEPQKPKQKRKVAPEDVLKGLLGQ
jgi:AsmA protein